MISMVVFIHPVDTFVYTEIISPIWRDSGEINPEPKKFLTHQKKK